VRAVTAEDERKEAGRALAMQRQLQDLGRQWHVVISTCPAGRPGAGDDWLLSLANGGNAVVLNFHGPNLARVIAAAWAGARPGYVS
jgi:hypothetical protein